MPDGRSRIYFFHSPEKCRIVGRVVGRREGKGRKTPLGDLRISALTALVMGSEEVSVGVDPPGPLGSNCSSEQQKSPFHYENKDKNKIK